MKNINKIQARFEEYDEASNKSTDYLIRSIEARISGNSHLARYIDNKVLPIVRKQSYKLFCAFDNEVQKNYQNKYENEKSKKQI